MQGFKKIGFYTGLIVALFALIFYGLDDISKAQLTVKTLGVHQKNIDAFSGAIDILSQGNFTKITHINDLSTGLQLQLEQYHNLGGSPLDSIHWYKLSDIYACEEEEWSGGCTASFPLLKLEYILFNENTLIACVLSGGYATSYWTTFYKINQEQINTIATFQSGPSLFDLALRMRFDKDLIEWESVGKENMLIQ